VRGVLDDGIPSAWIGSRSQGCPARWTGRIAFVRSVTSAAGARVEVEVVLADVAEDRRRAAVLDDVRGRGPRDGRRDHLVAGADVERESARCIARCPS
jgi:hypothetical protein